MLRRASGLGASYKINSAGEAVDCDNWSNLLESVCWNPLAPNLMPGEKCLADSSASKTAVVSCVAPPRVPTAAELASEDPDQVLANIAADQLAAQKRLNANQVYSPWDAEAASAAVDAGTAVANALPEATKWLLIAGAVAAVAAILIVTR